MAYPTSYPTANGYPTIYPTTYQYQVYYYGGGVTGLGSSIPSDLKCSGSVRKGEIVYFVPTKDSTMTIFNTTDLTFSKLAFDHDYYYFWQQGGYSGGVMLENIIYFVPIGRNQIGYFNLSSSKFDYFDISEGADSSGGGFSAAVAKYNMLYFVPVNLAVIGIVRAGVVYKEVHWRSSYVDALRPLWNEIAPGMTTACVLTGFTCDDYSCFGQEEVHCSDHTTCLTDTVNLNKATRPSWKECVVQAGSYLGYYEIVATFVILLGYLGCPTFFTSMSHGGDDGLANVVFQGAE